MNLQKPKPNNFSCFYRKYSNRKFSSNSICAIISLNRKLGKPEIINMLADILFLKGYGKREIVVFNKLKENFFFLDDKERLFFIEKCIFQDLFSEKKVRVISSKLHDLNLNYFDKKHFDVKFSIFLKNFSLSLHKNSPALWGRNPVVRKKKKNLIFAKKKRSFCFYTQKFFYRKMDFFLNFRIKKKTTNHKKSNQC